MCEHADWCVCVLCALGRAQLLARLSNTVMGRHTLTEHAVLRRGQRPHTTVPCCAAPLSCSFREDHT